MTPKPHLTPRQRQVFLHLMMGLENKAIAGMLGLSVGTVIDHKKEVLRIFQVHNEAQLIRKVYGLKEIHEEWRTQHVANN